MTTLAEIRSGWDQAAREDAMGNIVTIPDLTPAEFWQRGCDEIDAMLARLDKVGVEYKLGRALDFGCGVGRLTSALAPHFKRVDGVDISPEMIDQAKSLNIWPRRVEYHRNGKRIPFEDGTFDLVYSMIVLQHMPHRLQRGYVREFFRVLAPEGVAVFEVPPCPDSGHINHWLSMFGTAPATVEGWVDAAGGRLVDTEDLDGTFRYTAVRA